jgi:hypothetical protein
MEAQMNDQKSTGTEDIAAQLEEKLKAMSLGDIHLIPSSVLLMSFRMSQLTKGLEASSRAQFRLQIASIALAAVLVIATIFGFCTTRSALTVQREANDIQREALQFQREHAASSPETEAIHK